MQARDLAQQRRVDEPDQWRNWMDLVETLLIYRIPRLMRWRFGEAAALREPRLRQLSLEQGENLAEALLDFQSVADLDA